LWVRGGGQFSALEHEAAAEALAVSGDFAGSGKELIEGGGRHNNGVCASGQKAQLLGQVQLKNTILAKKKHEDDLSFSLFFQQKKRKKGWFFYIFENAQVGASNFALAGGSSHGGRGSRARTVEIGLQQTGHICNHLKTKESKQMISFFFSVFFQKEKVLLHRFGCWQ